MKLKLGYVIYYVENVDATLRFFENAFNLQRGFMSESGEYGELITGETHLGFANFETADSHGFKYQKPNPDRDPPAVEIGFVTDDVDAAYQLALQSGAMAASPPTQKPWGQTVAYVRDPNGFLIEICTAMGS